MISLCEDDIHPVGDIPENGGVSIGLLCIILNGGNMAWCRLDDVVVVGADNGRGLLLSVSQLLVLEMVYCLSNVNSSWFWLLI